MKNQIKINCDCGKVHGVTRTNEIPNDVISMGCNWCPVCEENASEHYNEWYNRNDMNEGESPQEPVPSNQLCMPFEISNILDEEIVVTPSGTILHVDEPGII